MKPQKTIIAWDTRLAGCPPAGEVVRTDQNRSLYSTVTAICKAAGHKVINLNIFCHGFEDNGQGGHGLQFSRDNILYSNFHRLAPLRKYVENCKIYACGAANVDGKRKGLSGDGLALCKGIARTMHAYVEASFHTQFYFPGGVEAGGVSVCFKPMDFGHDEGDVVYLGKFGEEIGGICNI